MKALILSTYDIEGGAARACHRLHQGLQAIRIDSQMLVQFKAANTPTIIAPKTNLAASIAKARITFDSLPLKLYPKRQNTTFSPQCLPDSSLKQINQINPDIINLHWINAGYIQIETLAKLKKPIVWTLHDMWAFTGGCHYTQGCDRYIGSCGACPQLGSVSEQDLSRWIWQRKRKSWQNLNLTVVTPSSWLAKCAQASNLFRDVRVEAIPNGLNTNIYRPLNRQVAREILQLPAEKRLVLFGASNANDKRKGFHLLQSALQSLGATEWKEHLELVVFGASEPSKENSLPFKTHYLGTVSDDISLSLIYAAADVFIAPSLEDNLPNTILEASACGTPSVAFGIGGMPDMIEHQINGYLAKPYEVQDLANGLVWVLENPERHQKLAEQSRNTVLKHFNYEVQAKKYSMLFQELINKLRS